MGQGHATPLSSGGAAVETSTGETFQADSVGVRKSLVIRTTSASSMACANRKYIGVLSVLSDSHSRIAAFSYCCANPTTFSGRMAIG